MEPTVNADGISTVHLTLVWFNEDSKLHSTVTAFHTAYTTMQPQLLGTDIPFLSALQCSLWFNHHMGYWRIVSRIWEKVCNVSILAKQRRGKLPGKILIFLTLHTYRSWRIHEFFVWLPWKPRDVALPQRKWCCAHTMNKKWELHGPTSAAQSWVKRESF